MESQLLSQQEFANWIFKELTFSELALLNSNIYLHSDHVKYYQKYACGKFDWCKKYLIKNRHLLTIEHTPDEYKQIQKTTIKMLKTNYQTKNN
jgi:hypothetical protein